MNLWIVRRCRLFGTAQIASPAMLLLLGKAPFFRSEGASGRHAADRLDAINLNVHVAMR
jgi:hypothetical protein